MLKLLIAILLAIPMLTAQVVTADNCVHQAGDNPDWARPDFDDSQWNQQYPAKGSPYIWTRCRLDLRSLPRTEQVYIEIRSVAAWELFVEGEAAGSFGDIRTGFGGASYQKRPIPGSVATRNSISLAVRQLTGRNNIPPLALIPVAGTQDALQHWRSNAVLTQLSEQAPSLLGGGFSLAIGILLLLLFAFSADKSQQELLWFGIYSLALGSFRCGASFPVIIATVFSDWLFIPCLGLANAVMALVLPRFFFALAGRPLPAFYVWLSMIVTAWDLSLMALALLAPIEQIHQVRAMNPFVLYLRMLIGTAAAAAFWPLWQVPRPLRLSCSLSLLFLLGYWARLMPQLAGFDLSVWMTPGANVQAGFNLIALIGLFVVIAQRHRQVALNRAELQGEMKAAQEVQWLLTSSTPDVAPWAAVDVAYLPAKEVGGDFYFCRQTQDGQLIVVGDVSGKGLRAGMLASAALGAVRALDTDSPASLLQGMNRVLHGQVGGGFVTCCAALIRKDGQLIVANAGHPSPYVGGQEFPVEAGLPLGIMPDSDYQESIGRGDSITLVSDGVVEAENGQRELFGFDQTREISMKSAQEIADTAKAWGQTDDITVVTVRRSTS